jgi:phosphatidylglycerophosphate synthase
MKKENDFLFFTVVRVLSAVVAGVLVYWHPEAWAVWALLVATAVSECSGLVHGLLTRHRVAAGVFDPYAGSVSRLIIYWSLAVTGKCWWAVPLVMAVCDVTTAYCRVSLATAGRDMRIRYTGRLKGVVQGGCAILLAGGFIFQPAYTFTVIIVLSAAVIGFTLISFFDDILVNVCFVEPHGKE